MKMTAALRIYAADSNIFSDGDGGAFFAMTANTGGSTMAAAANMGDMIPRTRAIGAAGENPEAAKVRIPQAGNSIMQSKGSSGPGLFVFLFSKAEIQSKKAAADSSTAAQRACSRPGITAVIQVQQSF